MAAPPSYFYATAAPPPPPTAPPPAADDFPIADIADELRHELGLRGNIAEVRSTHALSCHLARLAVVRRGQHWPALALASTGQHWPAVPSTGTGQHWPAAHDNRQAIGSQSQQRPILCACNECPALLINQDRSLHNDKPES
jgi:hypothetical protein